MWLLAVFIAVPLIEIALFIKVGGWLTLWPTLAIVILTALLGTALVSHQGRGVLEDLRRSLDDLRDPSQPLVHGAMILLAGALLLTPGFMTDAIGLALLVPAIREWAFRRIRRHVTIIGARGAGGGYRQQGGRTGFAERGDVIEGDYHVQDETQAHSGHGDHRNGAGRSSSAWTRH